MKLVLVWVAVLAVPLGLYAGLRAVAEQDGSPGPGYEQILREHNGRYNKYGWNHYGPGYFELDPVLIRLIVKCTIQSEK